MGEYLDFAIPVNFGYLKKFRIKDCGFWVFENFHKQRICQVQVFGGQKKSNSKNHGF